MFVMLSCLFIAALWSPAGKGLASWLSCVLCLLCFVTFPCGVLGQVWFLIVSILIFAMVHNIFFYGADVTGKSFKKYFSSNIVNILGT